MVHLFSKCVYFYKYNAHGNTWVEKTFTKYRDIDNDVYDEARRFISNIFKKN
ncbi:hypothetical protein SanJ4211_1867c [Streptococcus anginosus]|nr:hypothetical protein SanJ4211_1867c [Streptococcus anginosus]